MKIASILWSATKVEIALVNIAIVPAYSVQGLNNVVR